MTPASTTLAREIQMLFHNALHSMYVYFYLFVRAGLAKIDSSMIEAAQSLGHMPVDIVRKVTLPLLKPQLVAAALHNLTTGPERDTKYGNRTCGGHP